MNHKFSETLCVDGRTKNDKMYLQGSKWNGVDCIHLA